MVVSEHPLSSEIGAAILRRGGNAVDAAVAVGFAQAVVNPRAGNIGGGGFLVYRTARGESYALDFRETAPAAATRDMYLDARGEVTAQSVVGAPAAGVPAAVAGYFEMHRRFGRLPWRELVEPAIRLADGHEIDSVRTRVMELYQDRLRRFPSTAAVFLRSGRPPRAGERWRQPDLARTLELIADSGAAGFYRGRTADLIVAEMRRSGGLITHDDLAAYRAVWREPITSTYRGHRIISMPPPSSGGIVLAQMLNVLEGYRPLPPYGSAALLHLQVEAMRRAFTDRNRLLGDPGFVTMPVERLTSKSYAAELRRAIRRDRATPTSALPPVVEGQETTHFSVVDAEGNAAAVTTTINTNFGSRLVVTGAGFLLNNTMDDFASRPGTPNEYGLVQGEANAIQPGKRPLSAMTPTIVEDRRGRLALVLGAPGGPTIITSVLQVISNVVDHGMSLAEAVHAPRIHHQALPDEVSWEQDGILPGVREQLESMAHVFHAVPGHLGDTNPIGLAYWGVVEAIRVTPRGLEGVSDQRTPGGAAGW
jgi:gamma-glutamyltranspeptidase/glutathione hydrolase